MILTIFFVFILFTSSYASCPSGYKESYTDPNLCYSFQNKKSSFMDAEGICYGLKGHLVTVNSMFENMYLNELATSTFTDSTSDDYWIGATDTIKVQTWSWMDQSAFTFSNWDKGQPQNISDINCGAVKISYGKWIAEDCLKLKPFVCMTKVKSIPLQTTTVIATTKTLPPTPKTCPESWAMSKLTGFCYKIYFNATWADAETLCVTQGSHLASIHSVEEGLFIANLLPNIDMLDYCDDIVQTWIGLYTEDNNAHYYWTDGTPVDYIFWSVNQPDLPGVENCGQLRKFPVCGGTVLGDFNNFRCDSVVQHFVCKKSGIINLHIFLDIYKNLLA